MNTKRASRSTSYPSMSLPEALKKLGILKDSHGINGEYDREATAKGMGYGSLSGSSARAVAALVQYGLLNRSKDQYSISDLGKKYLMPVRTGQDDEAAREAALNPPLLRKIFDEYEGQPLPGQLKNILTITYGVQGSAADVALRVIKQSFKAAGLVTESGTLTRGIVSEDSDSVVSLEDSEEVSGLDRADPVSQATVAQQPIINMGVSQGANMTEQGINLTGDKWQLTVLLKTSKRHSAATRAKVRDLLAKADEVADLLYEEDTKE